MRYQLEQATFVLFFLGSANVKTWKTRLVLRIETGAIIN